VDQKIRIEAQREKLEEAYFDIRDSIRAAETIQHFILPSDKEFKSLFPQSFIFFKPKDIVSGDFYWIRKRGTRVLIAAADCEGHGVSGAFMSIIGHNLLNNSFNSSDHLNAANILNHVNHELAEELAHKEEFSSYSYGMDIALCVVDTEERLLRFAGAKNCLILLRNGELTQIAGNKFPIGQKVKGVLKEYYETVIPLENDDILYIFSDGFPDQLGGEDGTEKFLNTRFRELLISLHKEPLQVQKSLVETAFNQWKGDHDQLDDILVIGIKPLG
jgi:serine phosphatase RsbU (regulator of sigma subunit)